MKVETMKFGDTSEFEKFLEKKALKLPISDLPLTEEGKPTVFKSRRKAREAALQALFQCETLSDWSAGTIHSYFEYFHNLEIANLGAREGALRFCMELIEGVVSNGDLGDE